MAVSDTSKVDEILKRIEDLTSLYVKVGITSKTGSKKIKVGSKKIKAGSKKIKAGRKKKAMTMYELAKVHEFGCDIPVTNKMRVFFLHNFGFWTKKDVIKIPERSFIRTSFDENKDEIQTSGEDLIDMVIDGSLEVHKFYEILGETSVNAIKKFIIEGIDPPITQLTIDNKNGKSTPLINTGGLIHAIDYEIVGG